MKSLTFGSWRSPFCISSANMQFRYRTTKSQKSPDQIKSLLTPLKKRTLFTPVLPSDRLQELYEVTSIVVALNRVGWATISIDKPRVLNWDSYSLPQNFLTNTDETTLLETAHLLKNIIPNTELYVLENLQYKVAYSSNLISLRSMLIALLDNSNDGTHNMVFQKPRIINTLYSLSLPGYRVSARHFVEKHFLNFSENVRVKSSKTIAGSNCSLSINTINIKHFKHSSPQKQESLSIALLLAWSFLDVAVFQTPESLSRLQNKDKKKLNIQLDS